MVRGHVSVWLALAEGYFNLPLNIDTSGSLAGSRLEIILKKT
jgi:hypothetical protein